MSACAACEELTERRSTSLVEDRLVLRGILLVPADGARPGHGLALRHVEDDGLAHLVVIVRFGAVDRDEIIVVVGRSIRRLPRYLSTIVPDCTDGGVT